jgi:multicomponent Na+:H+ antiporter subunit B
MNNEILKISSGFLRLFFIVISVFMLMRGHNQPGGGFIGGIILASGFIVYGMAYGNAQLKKTLRAKPLTIIISGIATALFSALLGFLKNTFFEGLWLKIESIGFKAGTPLLFDIGVYLTVFGILMMIFLTIMEELEWK